MKRILVCVLVFGAATVSKSFAAQPGDPSADEAAIRKADEAYLKAYNSHDAKALADTWSPEAVYLNRDTGAEVVGRAAITDQFATYFKSEPDAKLTIRVESIQFVSPNVAVEHGVATTKSAKSAEEKVGYSAV